MEQTETFQPGQIIRRSLGLKEQVKAPLAADYHSQLVAEMMARGHRLMVGDVEFRLAKAFGFCYGVDRAVDLAYETLAKFPGRRIFLTSEIIHNPRVNNRLQELGIRFLTMNDHAPLPLEQLAAGDVVIIPAFGTSLTELQQLQGRGCVLVDSTCGSVVNVWRRVESYAKDRFTAIIHGKFWHEETLATSSRVTQYAGGKFLIVLDKAEAQFVCDFIEQGGDAPALLTRFAGAYSPGLNPATDLVRVGLANQTTMLSSESLEIAALFRQTMARRYGEPAVAEHFRSFDTICSATQERQDAILALTQEPDLDLVLVVGGYNSSNTNHLVEIAGRYHPAYHIEDAGDILSAAQIRHKPFHEKTPVIANNWLPVPTGPEPVGTRIGLTAGASTPNRLIGEVIERIAALRGLSVSST